MPGTFPTSGVVRTPTRTAAPAQERVTTRFEVDQTQPTTSVKIRLADGTRFVSFLFYPFDTPVELYQRLLSRKPYEIATTLPNRVLDDNTATIKDAGLVNSVVIQKWV
ncbi:uncharacterized protein LACBIDRAFT_314729 [Laccaria bicolor S238N-H82]|uniref:Predicted protein n=1 Tax=Laccaria bicolor (strain S238N-H82 / ATCC MYA-4686) TaxID=486041 RepID=B0DZ43_LACBS|nr:uncharacterized protein LACBIDRAFT_314729 [Laccaria bicolor S238N-H82]EDR00169.1 predicted protein [Laccaria bicolor S238N-H82]|eukprot:XP_001889226.1 predicted protein [Laccaria bicolor S238N-H82]